MALAIAQARAKMPKGPKGARYQQQPRNPPLSKVYRAFWRSRKRLCPEVMLGNAQTMRQGPGFKPSGAAAHRQLSERRPVIGIRRGRRYVTCCRKGRRPRSMAKILRPGLSNRGTVQIEQRLKRCIGRQPPASRR
jgi:hypothetical protein